MLPVFVIHICNRFHIGHTDLLPHFRGGGGDSGDVLETACGEEFHSAFWIIGILDEIDKAGRNQVRKMTDCSDNAVVLLIVEDNRDRVDCFCNLNHAVNVLLTALGSRSDNVVGVLKQVISRILIAGLLGACHRMTADKDILHAKLGHNFVNIALRASDISQDCTRLEVRANLREIAGIVFNRSA